MGTEREYEHAGARSILIVDDDLMLLAALERDLRGRGLLVHAAASVSSAVAEAQRVRPRYAVLDLCIGEGSGLELLQELKRITPDVVVLLLSGQAQIPQVVDAMQLGAVDFLQKPVSGSEVVAAIDRARRRISDTYGVASLARAEHEHITRVLNECNGNISEAARRLKIHRRSLQRKLQKQPPPG